MRAVRHAQCHVRDSLSLIRRASARLIFGFNSAQHLPFTPFPVLVLLLRIQLKTNSVLRKAPLGIHSFILAR